MSFHLVDLPDLSVASVSGVSTWASSNAIAGFSDAKAVTIYAPTTGQVHEIQINPSAAAATGSTYWATLTSGGSNVVINSGTAVTITDVGIGALRVQARGADTVTRVFKVQKQAAT